jgi:hypothetical protein
MTFHRVCNKSNTTGVTNGAGTAYTSGAYEFISGFLHLVGFSFLVLCCDLRYDFRVKTMLCSSLLPFALSEVNDAFVNVICFLFTYSGVQHDFHVR